MAENPNYYALIPANVRYNNELMPNAKLLYGEITALSNKEGICWATNEYFAKLYNVSERTITDWVKKLEELGFIKNEILTKRYDDGTIKKIREIHIELFPQNHIEVLQQNHIELFPQNHIEEKFAYNNTSNINNTRRKYDNIFTNANILSKRKTQNGWTKGGQMSTKEYEQEFEQLWLKYPNKKGKKDALRHYISARKKNVSYEEIDKGLDNYIAYLNNNPSKRDYIKHGSTWFNEECWNDEYNVEVKKQKYDLGCCVLLNSQEDNYEYR